jgi:hypothetical protein
MSRHRTADHVVLGLSDRYSSVVDYPCRRDDGFPRDDAPAPGPRGIFERFGVLVTVEDNLSSVLSEFARTMVTDFPIQGILDHLVQRIVDVLPITAAGVTLITPQSNLRYLAPSNSSALLYAQLQMS